MPLEPRDLVFPRGVLKPSQYPGQTLFSNQLDQNPEAIVDTWLEQAVELAPDSEAAQRAYVYFRHYQTQAERYAEEYSSWSEGSVSRSRSQASIVHFQRLAGAQQAIFERETGTAIPKANVTSGTTPIEASF